MAPDGKLVGMIELWLKRPRGPAGARIPRLKVDLGLAVAPEWRGRGVGTALLAAAEDWARAHGAERMILDLDVHNEGAKRLYERVGYQVEALAMDKPITPDPDSIDAPSIVRNLDGEVVPTLIGDQVKLRPVRQEDREALLEVLRDPSVARHLGHARAGALGRGDARGRPQLDGLGDRGRRASSPAPSRRPRRTTTTTATPGSTSSSRRGSRTAAWAPTPCGPSRTTSWTCAATSA